jgi:hypothetical protein
MLKIPVIPLPTPIDISSANQHSIQITHQTQPVTFTIQHPDFLTPISFSGYVFPNLLHDIIIGNNFPVSLVQLLQVSNYFFTPLNNGIPSCLDHYSDVFVFKTAKLPLPEHRPYDLGIILEKDKPLPKSKKIYSFSTPEHALLKEYWDDALDRQWI